MTATIETGATVRDSRAGKNPLKIRNIHHVELCAGNAKQSAFYYRKAFGFPAGVFGLETGNRETTSYVLSQGKIRFVITSPLTEEHVHSAAYRLPRRRRPGHRFLVDDVDAASHEAVRRARVRPRAVRRVRPVRPRSPRRRSAPTATRCIRSFRRPTTTDRSCPATSRAEMAGRGRGPSARRPHRRQRRERQDERLGHVLQQGARLPPVHDVRRQGHLDRVLGADAKVMADDNGWSSSRSTSRPPGKRKSQIQEYSIYTAGQACSTSPSRPATSSTPCRC